MILEALKRRHVEDDKLWEMVNRANQLTSGDFKSYDNNAPSLVPLMDRIIARSREVEDWRVYFYAMAKAFWLFGRSNINDLRRRFWISEVFHQDSLRGVGENVDVFGQEWRVDLAALILSFYMDYPQVDDGKLEQMLNIFLDFEQRYGNAWNRGDYHVIMKMAALKQDKKLAEVARKTLSKGDFKDGTWCYICYYIYPMIRYYVLFEDFGGIEEVISEVVQRTIPKKYQWCFARCESSKEKDMVEHALRDCLNYGSRELFAQLFARWKVFYQEKQKGERGTYKIAFCALAGDYSCGEDCLSVAEDDDKSTREHRQAPIDSMYWALCWWVYFRILDRNGVKKVRLRLGDGNNAEKDGTEAETKRENLPEWMCLDAAAYFERQADDIGAQMDRGRKWFNYGKVKQRYEACFLGEYKESRKDSSQISPAG